MWAFSCDGSARWSFVIPAGLTVMTQDYNLCVHARARAAPSVCNVINHTPLCRPRLSQQCSDLLEINRFLLPPAINQHQLLCSREIRPFDCRLKSVSVRLACNGPSLNLSFPLLAGKKVFLCAWISHCSVSHRHSRQEQRQSARIIERFSPANVWKGGFWNDKWLRPGAGRDSKRRIAWEN